MTEKQTQRKQTIIFSNSPCKKVNKQVKNETPAFNKKFKSPQKEECLEYLSPSSIKHPKPVDPFFQS
jgi:hypothetical protein